MHRRGNHIPCGLVMQRHEAREFVAPPPLLRLDRLRHGGMQADALGAQLHRVGHLLNQGMTKCEAFSHRRLPRLDQFGRAKPPQQRPDGRVRQAADDANHFGGKLRSYDRSGLQQRFFGVRQKIDTRADHRLDGRRQGRILPAGRRQPVAAPLPQQHAALRQRKDQLFREERIAVGSFGDMRHHLVEARAVAKQVANDLADLA